MALHLRATLLPSGDERDLYIDKGIISMTAIPDASTVHMGGWALPGLVDAHAHLAMASPVRGGLADQMRGSARVQLDAGVLLLRDPGGPGHDEVHIGPEDGLPRTISAGHFLAPRGRYFPGMARELHIGELAAAAEQEALSSGAWAKVIGDFMGNDGRMTPNFDTTELRAAADRVHAVGARITMHATTEAAIGQAIEAGFDAIEHGTELTIQLADRMAEQRMALVPTLVIGEPIRSFVRSMRATPAEERRWDHAVTAQGGMVKYASEAGVRILAGTDAGMVPHGLITEEVALLVRAGIAPVVAVGAASWDARAYFGLPGIEDHALADITLFAADPREDVSVLHHPLLRILDGQLVGAGP